MAFPKPHVHFMLSLSLLSIEFNLLCYFIIVSHPVICLTRVFIHLCSDKIYDVTGQIFKLWFILYLLFTVVKFNSMPAKLRCKKFIYFWKVRQFMMNG